MFRSNTVLVLGAGASCEVGSPSGLKLLRQIADGALIDGPQHGRSAAAAALHNYIYDSADNDEDAGRYIVAARRLRGAALAGTSIDTILYQHDGDVHLERIAKFLIALVICNAECDSALRRMIDHDDGYAYLSETWFYKFAHLLTGRMGWQSIKDLFNNLTIITFNYDRTVEFFLPVALKVIYGASHRLDIREACSRLKIIHPYGSLGPLQDEEDFSGVPFGGVGDPNYEGMATGIRTFGEQYKNEARLVSMRSALAEASTIIFAGFGYLEENLKLIVPPSGANARTVIGTVFEMPSTNVEVVKSEIMGLHTDASINNVRLHDSTCCGLFNEAGRLMTS